VTVVIRYAVQNDHGDEYLSHRRFNGAKSHVKWGPPRTARVWARKRDAKAMAEKVSGHVIAVHVQFGPPN
jgi:hypothetical protein